MRWCIAVLASSLFFCGATARSDATVEARIAAYSNKIAASPDEANLYLQRGLIYSENRQADLALQDVSKAEQLGDPVDAAFAHAILRYRTGELARAVHYLDRYIDAYPASIAALEYRFRVHRDAGNYAEALADYERLVDSHATLNPGFHLSAAQMLAASDDDAGVDNALQLLDARMAEQGSTVQLARYAIELELGRADYAAALARLSQLDEALRATPEWKVEVAHVLVAQGDTEQARVYLEAAAEQLGTLRPTRARKALFEKVRTLKQQLASLGRGAG